MKKTIVSGKTVDEAIENGLKILGLKREEVDVNIIGEGKSAVLGVFGGEDAKIEMKKISAIEEDARDTLQELLDRIGMMAIAETEKVEEDTITLNVKGEDLGKVIGKDGSMLEALQLLCSNIVSRNFKRRVRIYLDAGGYREKQEGALRRIAEEAAKDVVETGEEKILPPMKASERRIIHLALQENHKISTYSKGEGRDRRLVIAPRTNEEK